MACGAGNLTGCSVRRASRSRMGREGRLARLADGGFTARPRTCRLDRSAWSVILRILDGEQGQDMFRAVRSPAREQAVAPSIEQTTAADGHETRIPGSRVLNH